MSKILLLGVLAVAFVDAVVGTSFTCQTNNDLVDYNRVQTYIDQKVAPVSQRVQAVQDKLNIFEAKFESYKRNADAERTRLTTRITTLETNIRLEKECYAGDGRGYRGHVKQTKSGKTCQKWTSQSPQSHNRTPNNYPNHGLGNHNFCRNPDGVAAPWCYTMASNSRWEYCPVPGC